MPEDIRPYDESLSWHEYKVRDVLSGKLRARVIRVAHWTVLAGKAVPVSDAKGEVLKLKLAPFDDVVGLHGVNARDDLSLSADEPPRFLDLARPLPAHAMLEDERFDYFGYFSEQMKLYWNLRGQLRLVVMGNSHAGMGICTRLFYEKSNVNTPAALNLAPAGGSIELQCQIMRDYVVALPRLEAVIWVPSPRLFNARQDWSGKDSVFASSSGRRFDLTNVGTLWPVPARPRVSVAAIDDLKLRHVDPWGWEGPKKMNLPADDADAKKEILRHLSKPDFTVAEDRWKLFTDTLRALDARGVRVFLVTLPVHPLLKGASAADPDGTTHKGMAEIVHRLGALHVKWPRMWFHDFNLDATNDYAPREFYDTEHFNYDGATRFTPRLIEWMRQCAPEMDL